VARQGRLEGYTCLIVGGTSGIGLASARRFLEEGARVAVAGQAPEIDRSELARPRLMGPFWEFNFDLALGEPEVSRLFESALASLGGRMDILLHVAGISGRRFGDGALHECSNEGWQHVMGINALGVFLSNRAAVRLMRDQPPDSAGLRGSVVNIGSVLDRSPSPADFGTIAYAASKGAIRAMTLASAARYAEEKIRFNLVVPGLIDTPMARRATSDPRIRAYLRAKQPLAGGPGSPADVAEAALYLCEPASHFVTGTELVVDGGWCIAEGAREGEAPAEPAHLS
jgi:NAD(P)-dependent dehydrogenase (short-subunit alcohol dehydrogenase family)